MLKRIMRQSFTIEAFSSGPNIMSKKCAKMEIIDFLCGARMKSVRMTTQGYQFGDLKWV